MAKLTSEKINHKKKKLLCTTFSIVFTNLAIRFLQVHATCSTGMYEKERACLTQKGCPCPEGKEL